PRHTCICSEYCERLPPGAARRGAWILPPVKGWWPLALQAGDARPGPARDQPVAALALRNERWAALSRPLCSVSVRIEAVVETLSAGRHLNQKLRRLELRAILLLQGLGELQELLRPHSVDVGERAARIGR